MRMLVSDMAGRASIELKGKELGIDLGGDRELVGRVVERVKERELKGYTYEAADASFELLLRAEAEGGPLTYFTVESWRAIVEDRADGTHANEATVKLWAKGERIVATAEGNGPVNALTGPARRSGADLPAARPARPGRLQGPHPGGQARYQLHHPGPDLHLRRLGGVVDGGRRRERIAASWQALEDAYTYGLLRAASAPPSA
ncbi:(R)-citramalate synthase OS=Streptomyces fumanus OX=67302 GN=cimA PE=3 SV=1 [Streptomyces fumanus]